MPPGEWQTTGFALTSHMTLFIESGATINMLANISCDSSNKRCSAAHWRPRNDSCPSYPADVGPKDAAAASGVDERHSGYEPLLGAWNATNITITGKMTRYRCHLGCILLKMAAISLLTGVPRHYQPVAERHGGAARLRSDQRGSLCAHGPAPVRTVAACPDSSCGRCGSVAHLLFQ